MAGTVKLKDIAAAANCSANTVSRALRGCSDIGEETTERIRRIAAELNYVPDNTAVCLRNGKSNLVGVVAPSLTDPYISASADLLIRRLRGMDFVPIIMIARADGSGGDLLADIKANRVCAVISFVEPDASVIEYCRGGGHTYSRNGQYRLRRGGQRERGRQSLRRACRQGVCSVG